ncbi:MAG: ATP-binding cassette domain-containing protein [Clostridiales bacterium]|nr:ATP-binding cassette domain-containing protein [Clostridiales bacterium]
MEIKHATKQFGEKFVLRDFSALFPEKGVLCLFGPSGCGKTTLLNCIAGLVRLDSGEVTGMENRRISFLFQEDRLLPWVSAEENIAAVLRGSRERNLREARALLVQVGLAGEADKRPHELSGGMRQRVAIARALAFGGNLYLMDEPFHALDDGSKQEIISLFREKTPDCLKILVTHDKREAELLADEIWILEGPPLEIMHIITKC